MSIILYIKLYITICLIMNLCSLFDHLFKDKGGGSQKDWEANIYSPSYCVNAETTLTYDDNNIYSSDNPLVGSPSPSLSSSLFWSFSCDSYSFCLSRLNNLFAYHSPAIFIRLSSLDPFACSVSWIWFWFVILIYRDPFPSIISFFHSPS